MKRTLSLLIATLLSSGALGAREPLLAIACHLEPEATSRRANGYDCTVRSAVRAGEVIYDDDASDDEKILRRGRAFRRLAWEAEAACGADCRFFFGGAGRQCLAVAQSERFTGLGAFTGRETTLAQAERTALRDCEEFVGTPGESCSIILSQCTYERRYR